jgi:hypothetical protein
MDMSVFDHCPAGMSVTAIPVSSPHTSIIQDRIDAHIRAVEADEACFDDNGVCLDFVRAEEAEAAEKKAFLLLAIEPCLCGEDVADKADYILNGTVGQRETLLQVLLGPDGGNPTDVNGPLVRLLGSFLSAGQGETLSFSVPPAGEDRLGKARLATSNAVFAADLAREHIKAFARGLKDASAEVFEKLEARQLNAVMYEVTETVAAANSALIFVGESASGE